MMIARVGEDWGQSGWYWYLVRGTIVQGPTLGSGMMMVPTTWFLGLIMRHDCLIGSFFLCYCVSFVGGLWFFFCCSPMSVSFCF
jgi:hypothetical protein